MKLEYILEAGVAKIMDAYKDLVNSSFPIKIPSSPKVLGQGTQGVAFDIGKGKILKITGDESEAKASSLFAKKNYRGIWKVHNVFETERYWPRYWFIVGEKLKEDRERAIDARWIIEEFSYNSKYWNKSYFEKAIDIINNPNPEHEGNWGEPDNIVLKFDKNSNARKDAIELAHGLHNLNKLGISFQDLITGNIMFRGDKAVIIDVGYSRSGWGETDLFEGVKDNKAIELIAKELQDTKQAAKILGKILRRKHITPQEQAELEDQAKDIAKGLGYAAIFAAPGGSIILPIIKYLQQKR